MPRRPTVRTEAEQSELTTVAARSGFADLVNRVAYGKERVALTRRGRRIAAVVPIEDIDLLERLEEIEDVRDARRAIREFEKKGGISWDKLKRKLEL